MTDAATPRTSLIGELRGRRLSELNRVQGAYQPHPVLAGVATMRWLPSKGRSIRGFSRRA